MYKTPSKTENYRVVVVYKDGEELPCLAADLEACEEYADRINKEPKGSIHEEAYVQRQEVTYGDWERIYAKVK